MIRTDPRTDRERLHGSDKNNRQAAQEATEQEKACKQEADCRTAGSRCGRRTPRCAPAESEVVNPYRPSMRLIGTLEAVAADTPDRPPDGTGLPTPAITATWSIEGLVMDGPGRTQRGCLGRSWRLPLSHIFQRCGTPMMRGRLSAPITTDPISVLF